MTQRVVLPQIRSTELISVGELLPDAVTGVLVGYFRCQLSEPVTLERVYLETFDERLTAAGLTLAREAQTDAHGAERLVLSLAGGAQLIGEPPVQAAVHRPAEVPTRLFARELHAGELREALLPVAGVRAMLEFARVRVKRWTLAVLDELEKTVARVIIEQPEGLNGRIQLQPLRGYDREAGHVLELLAEHAGFSEPKQSLVHEAVQATGGQPGAAGSAVQIELIRDEPADEAVARILTRLREINEANLSGALGDVDIEFLHAFRVSLRRMRAVLRQLEGVFPQARFEHYRSELRWLQRITAETRDLDVHLEDLTEGGQLWSMVPGEQRVALGPLTELLHARRAAAHQSMVTELRGQRAELLRWQWGRLLDMLPLLPLGDRPDAKRTIDALSGARIRKVYKRMLKTGAAINRKSSPHAYHELRKQGKELRYLLELFGRPLQGAKTVDPMIKTLKRLQDVLGRHQDREIQIETLLLVIDDLAGNPGNNETLLAANALIASLEEDAAMARAQFHTRFADFASASQRRLIKDTFSK